MASIKDLKKRIGTVKNTQQTTRAMKMVSAAKLRRAQDAIQSHRPYARRISDLIRLATAMSEKLPNIPLLTKHTELAADAPRKLLLVLVTSDRGLCGGFNSNIIKAAQRWLAANEKDYQSVQLAFVGRRGFDFFKVRRTNLGPYYAELGGKVTFAKAKKLSDTLVAQYLNGEFDEIKFIYNEFKNAVSQKVNVEDFLPLLPAQPEAGQTIPDYIVRPTLPVLLAQLVEKNFSVQAFRILLDSQASEHGARMSAMENATKNAGEMIRKLALQYNKQRQASITKELLEIISGSESQKSAS